MAPIRRYIRVRKHLVLECRIYLDNPALTDTWFLHPRDPVLPRLIESVRPLILPKLREEDEKARVKGRKTNKAIKDVVVQDDFEVVIFLTDPSTRHSLLIKHTLAAYEGHGRDAQSSINSNQISNQGSGEASAPLLIREERSEEADQGEPRSGHDEVSQAGSDGEDEDGKKPVMRSQYDGFSIHGRVLCLIVKRRQGGRESGRDSDRARARAGPSSGSAMMEDWVASTQLGHEEQD